MKTVRILILGTEAQSSKRWREREKIQSVAKVITVHSRILRRLRICGLRRDEPEVRLIHPVLNVLLQTSVNAQIRASARRKQLTSLFPASRSCRMA